jgi:DNA-binding CsgD family transcriptional regulator
MNRAPDERVQETPGRLDEVARALGRGLVLVDVDGRVVWMDPATRRRVNGELRSLPLPLARPSQGAVDCFASSIELAVHGEPLNLCVLQQVEASRESSDLIAAIEGIMADSTSWFTRTVIEKLKSMRQAGDAEPAPSKTSSVDLLSDREREVLGLICEGRSDVQMGQMLGLSENTVRNHIASLYRKIGVNRRTAAIIWARERGITGRDGMHIDKRRRPSTNGKGRTLSY